MVLFSHCFRYFYKTYLDRIQKSYGKNSHLFGIPKYPLRFRWGPRQFHTPSVQQISSTQKGHSFPALKSLTSTPKTPVIHTKNPSVQHQKPLSSSHFSVSLQKALSSTHLLVPHQRPLSSTQPSVLRGFWCLTEGVWCGTEGFLVLN